MRINFVLRCLTIFAFLLVGKVVFAEQTYSTSSLVRCDAVKLYCDYQGLYNDINNTDEEFKMLLEPNKHANFQAMFGAIFYLSECSKVNPECMKALKDQSCGVSVYVKKLIKFFDENKKNIADAYVLNILEYLKKSVEQ